MKFVMWHCIFSALIGLSWPCRKGNKEVGVCLHVYLERDFLSLERIVYPQSSRLRRRFTENFAKNRRSASHYDPKSHRDWVEGPELTDYCKKLKEVVKCFQQVLVDCETGYDFFRYRHLLYSLDIAHKYVCSSPLYRKDRFLQFLKTIECAEKARVEEKTCHRHNVSDYVWNQILRAEIGEEICDSLNTQRACLLDHNYIHHHCNNEMAKVDIYRNLSNVFLSTWCRLPLNPNMLPSTANRIYLPQCIIMFVIYLYLFHKMFS